MLTEAQFKTGLRNIKRSIGRLEFCRDWVVSGKLDKAWRKNTTKIKIKNDEYKSPRSYSAKFLLADKEKPKKSIKNKIFTSSSAWRELRKKALKNYGTKCMKCGNTEMPNVDHILPKSKYPELALEFNNLQILCWPCNKTKNNKDITDYRGKERDNTDYLA